VKRVKQSIRMNTTLTIPFNDCSANGEWRMSSSNSSNSNTEATEIASQAAIAQ
jgi:hypothetical protein